MTAPILVTGGTGTLGRLLVPLLRAPGREIRILSRSAGPVDGGPVDGGPGAGAGGPEADARELETGAGAPGVGAGRPEVDPGDLKVFAGDLETGAGVDAAVSGVDIVVHLAGSAKGDELKARTLVRAATRAGVRHLVYISVVGADRVPVRSAIDRAGFGYFAQKRAAEQIIAGSGIPWTTLRATQFFDLALTVARSMAKLPVIVVPAGVRFQPVDTGEVAARLAALTLGAPAGLVPDLAGPRIYGMGEMVRAYLTAAGKRRPILPVRFAGAAYRAVRDGANLAPEHADGRRTWEEFLATRAGATALR